MRTRLRSVSVSCAYMPPKDVLQRCGHTFASTMRLLSLSCVVLLVVFSPCLVRALTVHLVPHTHDDAGWLKTVDQYYLGQDPLSSCDRSHLHHITFFIGTNHHVLPVASILTRPLAGMVIA